MEEFTKVMKNIIKALGYKQLLPDELDNMFVTTQGYKPQLEILMNQRIVRKRNDKIDGIEKYWNTIYGKKIYETILEEERLKRVHKASEIRGWLSLIIALMAFALSLVAYMKS